MFTAVDRWLVDALCRRRGDSRGQSRQSRGTGCGRAWPEATKTAKMPAGACRGGAAHGGGEQPTAARIKLAVEQRTDRGTNVERTSFNTLAAVAELCRTLNEPGLQGPQAGATREGIMGFIPPKSKIGLNN